MKRRSFLKALGITPAIAALPAIAAGPKCPSCGSSEYKASRCAYCRTPQPNTQVTSFKVEAPGNSARMEFNGAGMRVYDANGVLRVQSGVWS